MFKVDKDKCLRCGGCVSVCPKDALELTEQGIVRDEKKCTECGVCARFCPVGAIKVEKGKKP
ncbi:MAG: 4Fe-4S binding protein [Candidatus Aenigmarchaeota archaeon]|nr:4Fe-4S binding protein [Candidatus Aenigmarchaeota archaeon]